MAVCNAVYRTDVAPGKRMVLLMLLDLSCNKELLDHGVKLVSCRHLNSFLHERFHHKRMKNHAQLTVRRKKCFGSRSVKVDVDKNNCPM